MTIEHDEIGIRETSPNVWRITYNGNVLEDSRGYRKEQAIAVAKCLVAEAAWWPDSGFTRSLAKDLDL